MTNLSFGVAWRFQGSPNQISIIWNRAALNALVRVRDSLWSAILRHLGKDLSHLHGGHISKDQSIISDLLSVQQKKRSTLKIHFIWLCFAIDFMLRWGDEKSLAFSTQHELPLQSGNVKWILGQPGGKKEGAWSLSSIYLTTLWH